MWCDKCQHETENQICEVCGSITDPVIPTEVYWCSHCNIPIIRYKNDIIKDECPICGGKAKHIAADMRAFSQKY